MDTFFCSLALPIDAIVAFFSTSSRSDKLSVDPWRKHHVQKRDYYDLIDLITHS
jgi:hypothetical protein